jgi:predicted lipoprotein with Yx(FWY)xxD motif
MTAIAKTVILVAAAMTFGACPGDAPREEPSVADTPPTTSMSEPSSSAPGVRIGSRSSDRFGGYLTDANGRAVYLLESDEGAVACVKTCLTIWPPLLAGSAAPVAADSAVRADLLGTTTRADGALQVTYGGHALYYYLGDAQPGDTFGQHVEDAWGEWYLVSLAGQEVEVRIRPRGRDR